MVRSIRVSMCVRYAIRVRNSVSYAFPEEFALVEIQLENRINIRPNPFIQELLTMDDEYIAIGSYRTAEIQVFDRTSLKLSKV